MAAEGSGSRPSVLLPPFLSYADEGGPPALRRLTPGVVGTLQYSAPELLNEDLRPQGNELFCFD